MPLTAELLSPGLQAAAVVIYLVVLGAAALRAPWGELLHRQRSHVFLGGCTALLVLWQLEAGVTPGLGYHYLGATALTLIFGWPLAILGLSLVQLAVALNGDLGASVFALNGLLHSVLPVLVSYGIYRGVVRWLPPHLFTYLFLCAFFGAALAAALTAAANIGVLVAEEAYSVERIRYEYLGFLPMIAFAEAWITGIIMTMLVTLRPGWVSTYDEAACLGPKA